MINIETSSENFKTQESWKKIGNTQYYIIRIKLSEKDDVVYAVEKTINHVPKEEDFVLFANEYLNAKKKSLLKAINEYDNSSSVNSFFINGTEFWLDKATRVGLMNSLSIEKDAGKIDTLLYMNGTELEVPINVALAFLAQIELYALSCYRQTEAHKKAVSLLETVSDAENYDFTTGYPEKLNFNL